MRRDNLNLRNRVDAEAAAMAAPADPQAVLDAITESADVPLVEELVTPASDLDPLSVTQAREQLELLVQPSPA